MSSVASPSLFDLPPPDTARLFSVDEFLKLVSAGFFGPDERLELLEGWIVPKMTRNPPHAVGVALADDALRALLPAGWHVRNQGSIATADSVPEPDLAVVRGSPRDYRDRHPRAGDAALVVEVADSSLADDRLRKGQIYAKAAIPAYWIVNLVDRRVEIHTDPTGPGPSYRSRQEFGIDDAVPLVIDGSEAGRIAVRDLLP